MSWTFFTNHAHVLVCLARDPDLRVRDLALRVGITERAVQRILSDLTDAGYLEVRKDGRRNHYELVPGLALRHPVEEGVRVGDLLRLLASAPPVG